MKKKIQFSLVYRDMWQSSGKFQPRKDQLAKIAPVIIEMGCFSRVETNGVPLNRLTSWQVKTLTMPYAHSANLSTRWVSRLTCSTAD